MGANKSSPKIAEDEHVQIYVSPSVVNRLENGSSEKEEKSNEKTMENDSFNNSKNPHLELHQEEKQQEHQQKQQLLQKHQQKPQSHHLQQQQKHQQERQSHQQQQQQQQRDDQGNLVYKRGREGWIHHSNDLSGYSCSELEFEKTSEILRNSFSKALQRTNNPDIEIEQLRNQLIGCHREHPDEPLCCSELAEKFQELVFREQFLNILGFNLKMDK